MSVLGWIIAAGIFLFGMSVTYSTAGLGGSVLMGGFMALIYVAWVARPSARPQPTTLDVYGRVALGNLLDEYARVPGASDEFMPRRYLVRRGRAPSDRERAGLIGLAALMQRVHENPRDPKDYAALRANSEAMESTFKLIYGHDPSYYERDAFTNMIGTAYPREGSASVSAADESGQDLSSRSAPGGSIPA
ncbi:MAG: hypothetical protein ABSC46_02405 [Candidatus Limnocylindrales bacterium]